MDCLQTNIRHSLDKRRHTYLTLSELSIVKEMIDNITDKELEIMKRNFSDSVLFVAPTTNIWEAAQLPGNTFFF
jgi:hypothetical protein